MKDFRLFQTERVCRRQFELVENGRKLSKQIQNTEGKGEIACYEQFLLFPQCFQRHVLKTRKNQVLFGKGLSELPPRHDLNIIENCKLKTLRNDNKCLMDCMVCNAGFQ